ncbi:MAG: hypothetical protein O6952_06990 [Planctomycetota bacterium]|nr:hypothetical protein [Planctomycetota bacterium]
MKAEDHHRRSLDVSGRPILLTSFKLDGTFHATAEINLPGAGARLGRAEGGTREEAEEKVIALARESLGAKGNSA